jgi:hypothetical protein
MRKIIFRWLARAGRRGLARNNKWATEGRP